MTHPRPILLTQAAKSVMDPMPWPILVNPNGRVESGRPDAWHLLGFQKDLSVQHVDIVFTDMNDIQEAVNTYPVFSALDGSGIFVVQQPVDNIRYYGKAE